MRLHLDLEVHSYLNFRVHFLTWGFSFEPQNSYLVRWFVGPFKVKLLIKAKGGRLQYWFAQVRNRKIITCSHSFVWIQINRTRTRRVLLRRNENLSFCQVIILVLFTHRTKIKNLTRLHFNHPVQSWAAAWTSGLRRVPRCNMRRSLAPQPNN